MEQHKLVIEPGYMVSFEGECSCSDPDLEGETWTGHVVFYGRTREEVEEQHRDHLDQLG